MKEAKTLFFSLEILIKNGGLLHILAVRNAKKLRCVEVKCFQPPPEDRLKRFRSVTLCIYQFFVNELQHNIEICQIHFYSSATSM
jgi:hypothetical protein